MSFNSFAKWVKDYWWRDVLTLHSRAKMKKWFEKWLAEKAKRKEKGLPQIVDYRDETYVSCIQSQC